MPLGVNKEEHFYFILQAEMNYLELLGRMQYDMTIDKDTSNAIGNGYAFQNHFLNSFRNSFPTTI